jgi:hypothetical protein
VGEIGTGVAAARRKISSSMLLIFEVLLSSIRLELFEMLDSGKIARVVTTGGDLAVAPSFEVDAIEFELICFGGSGFSMLLPFWIED